MSYQRAFAAFLQCTSEKSDLLAFLSVYVEGHEVTSLLDIGPGSGELSIPLSKLVREYAGIEPIGQYARMLRSHGLNVRHATFPCVVERQFDLVHISHVLTIDSDLETFLAAAWSAVEQGGSLLVISHSGAESSWQALSDAMMPGLPIHRAVFGRIAAIMERFGRLEHYSVESSIESTDVQHMIDALGFVWSDGDEGRWRNFLHHRSSVEAMLRRQYRSAGKYRFPFRHSILSVSRD